MERRQKRFSMAWQSKKNLRCKRSLTFVHQCVLLESSFHWKMIWKLHNWHLRQKLMSLACFDFPSQDMTNNHELSISIHNYAMQKSISFHIQPSSTNKCLFIHSDKHRFGLINVQLQFLDIAEMKISSSLSEGKSSGGGDEVHSIFNVDFSKEFKRGKQNYTKYTRRMRSMATLSPTITKNSFNKGKLIKLAILIWDRDGNRKVKLFLKSF